MYRLAKVDAQLDIFIRWKSLPFTDSPFCGSLMTALEFTKPGWVPRWHALSTCVKWISSDRTFWFDTFWPPGIKSEAYNVWQIILPSEPNAGSALSEGILTTSMWYSYWVAVTNNAQFSLSLTMNINNKECFQALCRTPAILFAWGHES